jgi:hypothetical protein
MHKQHPLERHQTTMDEVMGLLWNMVRDALPAGLMNWLGSYWLARASTPRTIPENLINADNIRKWLDAGYIFTG